jgi:pimeloyl-ACP methyl ester carboxylesterase
MKRAFKWIGGLLLVALIALFAIGYTADTDPAAMRAKYASPESQFIDVGGGLTMHVRDEGKRDGPVLVLLHGSNASLHTWEPWVARLSAKYRIISVDQIGHGLTGPNPTGQYDGAAFVGTLNAALTKLGVTRFALAGNSMGGWVAWEYALAYPEKVAKLVLIDASGAPISQPPPPALAFRVAQSPWLAPIVPYITPRSLVANAYSHSVENKAVVTDEAITRTWELLRYPGNRAATIIRQQAFPNRPPATPAQMGQLTMPTLILWGGNDTTLPPAGADWFAQRIPGAQKIVYPGIGHLPMEETPDRSAADVDAFLSKPFPSAAKPPSIAPTTP